MLKKLAPILLGAFALSSLSLAQYQAGSPWPKAQADNANTGRGIATVPSLAQKWYFGLGTAQNLLSCGPAMVEADGTIHLGFSGGSLLAVTGDGVDNGLGGPYSDQYVTAPAIGADGTLYVVGTSGSVYAFNTGGYNNLWATAAIAGGMQCGPTILPTTGNRLFVLGYNSDNVYTITSGTSGGTVTAGEHLNEQHPANPAVGPDGSAYYAGNFTGLVHGLLAGGGSWSVFPGDGYDGAPTLDSSRHQLYLAGSNGKIQCLNALNGATLWSNPTGDSFSGGLALSSSGTVYTASHFGSLYAFSPSGTLSWAFNTNGDSFGSCSPVIDASGTIIVGSIHGIVYAVSASGSLLWTNSIGSQINGLAIGSDGSLYVSTNNGLYALGVQTVSKVTVSPAVVIGGIGSTGTVTLAQKDASLTTVVFLSSNSTYVNVPAHVSIAAGATTASFAITTTAPPTTFTATITAESGGISPQTAAIQVYSNYVTGLSLSPTTVTGGGTSIGEVFVYSAALSGGYVVNVSSEYPNSVGVPSTVTIQPGFTNAKFSITTNPARCLTTFGCDIYVSAPDHHSGAQATLNVQGDSVAGVTLSPTSIGPNQTSTGTVKLRSPAPTGGYVVNLTSEYPGSVSVNATVIVSAGQTSAGFVISPVRQFPNTFVCVIRASDANSAAQANLTVQGDSLASISVNPTTVVGGTSCTGTVTLTAKAPPGGWKVFLSTEYPTIDTVEPEALVQPNSLSATFTITTTATGADYPCGIYASDGHSGKQVTLMITHS